MEITKNQITSKRSVEGLSGKSPAGRTFAWEFAKLQQVQNDLQREIERSLAFDRDFQDFRTLEESGVSAIGKFRASFFESGLGRTPVGILGYTLMMPDGKEDPISREVRIHLDLDGAPVFRVNTLETRTMGVMAMLMSASIGHMLLKK